MAEDNTKEQIKRYGYSPCLELEQGGAWSIWRAIKTKFWNFILPPHFKLWLRKDDILYIDDGKARFGLTGNKSPAKKLDIKGKIK